MVYMFWVEFLGLWGDRIKYEGFVVGEFNGGG